MTAQQNCEGHITLLLARPGAKPPRLRCRSTTARSSKPSSAFGAGQRAVSIVERDLRQISASRVWRLDPASSDVVDGGAAIRNRGEAPRLVARVRRVRIGECTSGGPAVGGPVGAGASTRTRQRVAGSDRNGSTSRRRPEIRAEQGRSERGRDARASVKAGERLVGRQARAVLRLQRACSGWKNATETAELTAFKPHQRRPAGVVGFGVLGRQQSRLVLRKPPVVRSSCVPSRRGLGERHRKPCQPDRRADRLRRGKQRLLGRFGVRVAGRKDDRWRRTDLQQLQRCDLRVQ
jgi:hypothetical protein